MNAQKRDWLTGHALKQKAARDAQSAQSDRFMSREDADALAPIFGEEAEIIAHGLLVRNNGQTFAMMMMLAPAFGPKPELRELSAEGGEGNGGDSGGGPCSGGGDGGNPPSAGVAPAPASPDGGGGGSGKESPKGDGEGGKSDDQKNPASPGLPLRDRDTRKRIGDNVSPPYFNGIFRGEGDRHYQNEQTGGAFDVH